MMAATRMKILLVTLVVVILAPAAALAQAAIAGSVRDPSGAPLSGVTVDATSSSLIEGKRTAITDDAGRYRIDDVRPGIYEVRFTADGWRPQVYADVVLTGASTTVVDGRLEIGPLSETVHVRAVPRPLDITSSVSALTLGDAQLKAIPTTRGYNAVIGLVPGVVTSANDVVTSPATVSFPIHGGRTNEGRLMIDGVTVGSPPSGNSATSYALHLGDAREVVFTSADGLGERETAGLVVNVIPKEGGNTVRGAAFVAGTAEALQSDNVTPVLRQQGVNATPLNRVYDVWGSVGGPIRRDRVWYFAGAHIGGYRRNAPNVYANVNAGDPAQWLYVPDVTRPEYSDRTFENGNGRITWKATARQTVSGFWDAQVLCRSCTGATPGLTEPPRVSPEAVGVLGRPLHVWQGAWSSARTDRLLLEARYGGTAFGVGNFERDPNPTRDLVRVMEQCASGCPANGGIPGLVYRSQDYSVAHAASHLWTANLAWITGSRSVKAGYQHTLMTDDRTWFTNTQNLTYRFNNGIPNQLTQSISPWVNNARAAWDGLFVETRWMWERLTVQAALRFDRAYSWFPPQQEGPSRFLPTPIVVPQTTGVDSYRDLSPRLGVAYDLFGTGSTVLRAGLGKYLEGVGINGNYANTNPTLRLPQTTMVFGTAGVTRAWIDANRNYVADCNLLDPDAQDLRAAGGDLCGVMSNTSFGRNVLSNAYDPRALEGWGVRPSDWDLSVAMERQFLPRGSVSVAYIRRTFRGFFVVDNRELQQGDFTPFSVAVPLDPRLPGGGGNTISGLYDVVPEKAGRVANFVTSAGRYGAWTQYYNGLDVTLSVRNQAGLTVSGGTSTGQTVADNCAVRARVPELATMTTGTSALGAGLLASVVSPVSPYCHAPSGILTQLRGLASYAVPKIDVQLAATIQSKPGPMLAANYSIPTADVQASLGRPLSGSAPNVTVNLVPPGAMYGDRINEIDARAAKLLSFGYVRTTVALEIYNALNSGAVLSYNMAFVPQGTWLQPMNILTPRMFRVTADVEF